MKPDIAWNLWKDGRPCSSDISVLKINSVTITVQFGTDNFSSSSVSVRPVINNFSSSSVSVQRIMFVLMSVLINMQVNR